MTQPADIATFDPTKRKTALTPATGQPTSVTAGGTFPTQPTSATPAQPTDNTFTPPPANPVILDPTTGQTSGGVTTSTGQVVKQFDQNDPSTYTVRHNADGSTDYLDLRGVVVMHSNPPAAPNAPGGSPGNAAGGAGQGLAPPIKDIQGNSISSSPWRIQQDGTVINTQTGQVTSFASLPQGTIVTDAGGTGLVRVTPGNGLFDATATPVSPFNPNGDVAPSIAATVNNTALETRVQNQTTGDIAGISAAGATGVNTALGAANDATATGNQVYSDAATAANNARTLGATGLTTAQTQGASAVQTGFDASRPLTALASEDVDKSNLAGAQAQDLATKTGMSLDEAQSIVNQILGINTTAPTTGALTTFQGSAGTAPALASFNPTATRTAGFTGSAGDAASLEGLDTTTPGTGALANFRGTSGTADELASTPTSVSSTQDLLDFEGNTGTADELKGLNTSVDTSPLTTFTPTGGQGLTDLERFASGADIGPSAAEAQLREQSDRDMSQSIALARSGRGAGANASAMRQAIFQNAATGQQTNEAAATLRAEEAATQRQQNIGAATSAAGTQTALSGQALTAAQATVAARTQAVQDRITALTQSGAMTQKQADQMLAALQSGNAAQLQGVADQIQALTASGQLSETQAGQVLDALKSVQQGQETAIAQKSTNLATAGTQRQVQASQQLDALKSQQAADLQAAQERLSALVASGQMTQAQAQEQLDALKTANAAELTSTAQKIQAATAAAGTQVNVAQVQSDLTKAFSSLGLQYDVNSGQLFDQAGNLIQGGDKIAADLLQTGLTNQVGQGQIATTAVGQGTQALTTLTNTSVDAKKAAAVLGFQSASQIAALSQGELQQLNQIVQSQNNEQLQKYLADKGIQVQVDQQNAQQTAAIVGAIGTIAAGAALLSDVRAKEDVQPMGASDWFNGLQFNNGLYREPPPTEDTPLSNAQKSALLNMGTAIGGLVGRGIASDERSKKKRKPETFEEWIGTNFRPAKGYSYRYKDPDAPGAAPGRHYGPLAQDLLKTGARDAVFEAPNGMLAVDPRKTVMPMLAAVGEQQRRIDELEVAMDVVQRILSEPENPKTSSSRSKTQWFERREARK